MSDTLKSIGLVESPTGRIKVWFRKKPIDLCPSESEGDEDGVGTGPKFYSVFRYTIVNRSRRICCHKVKGFVVNYESLIRELKTKTNKTIYGFRCDERLKTKVEESTRLACILFITESLRNLFKLYLL